MVSRVYAGVISKADKYFRRRNIFEYLDVAAHCTVTPSCARSSGVLRVADVFHPVDDLAVERFRNRNVSHRCGRRRAVPVCPSGCVCQAVRAPGSNVTLAPLARAGSGALNSGSMRTVPVNHSAGPFPDGCVPFRLISIL
jgi:hypothetical protein